MNVFRRCLLIRLAGCAVLLSLPIGSTVAAPWLSGPEAWLEMTVFDYSESRLMQQKGTLLGLGGSYTFSLSKRLYLRLNGDYRLGTTDYKGQTWSGIPATAEANDHIWHLEGRLGSTYRLENGRLALEVGFGARDWSQNLKDGRTTDGEITTGYKRGHHYMYLPLGVSWAEERSLNRPWSWNIGTTYQHIFAGYNSNHFRGGSEERILMDDGYGLRFYGGVTWFNGIAPRLRTELYLQRWRLQDSELGYVPVLDTAIMEPENKTREIGLRVAMGF